MSATPRYLSQNFSTTLNVGGGINASQTTGIILTSISGLNTSGGWLCLDWAAALDASVAEYVKYTGITGNELTGVVRGDEGSSGKAHSNGATIVAVLSKSHVNLLADKLRGVDVIAVEDVNGNEILKSGTTASAVNEVTITNAATGTAPAVAATGDDTDINLKLLPKGAGVVVANGPLNYGADAGANDTYVITVTGVSALVTGLHIRFKANTANTGAATLNVNSLGAKTIKKNKSADLSDNDILSGQIVDLVYDGTNFEMQSQLANSSSGLTSKVINFTRDISTASGSQAVTGVGFVPTSVQFFAGVTGTAIHSIGGADSAKAGTGQYFLDATHGGSIPVDILASGCICLVTATSNYSVATITSYDADGVTLAWTKAGTPTGTAAIGAIFYR